ncbi:hypothetical protein BC828DRAFT_199521 [Blastocladiella britannica]|nr:hypothetical protein BC828DRAFT_199521 [Blastocladiella britannica]
MSDVAAPTLAPIQLLDAPTSFVVVAWVLSVATLLAFTGAAVFLTWRHLKHESFNTDSFLTARGTQPWYRIAWSFFAGALGAWAIGTPASFAASSGILGTISYAVSTGIPVVLVSYAGSLIQRVLPRPLSLSDYVLWRYGRPAQIFVAVLTIVNMSLFVISEYSTVGSIFKSFLHSSQYPIIILVSLVTAGYTAYGGLLISLVTDQLQGIAAVLLSAVLVIYLAVSFPTGAELPPFPTETLGFTSYGWSTWVTLPLSLIASTFFSEANWQRVWAAESPRALHTGAAVGCFMLIVVVGVFGVTGLLATWAYAPYLPVLGDGVDTGLANLFMFYSLGDKQYSWIGMVIVVLTVTLNMSAVDSIQNALTANITANLFRSWDLKRTRLLVFVLNVPLMIVGFFTLPALNLFLVTNLLAVASFIPLISGLADPDRKFISGYTMMFSSVCGMVALVVYGWITQGNFADGFVWAWWSNNYDLWAFLVPFFASIIALVAWTVLAVVAEKVLGWKGQGYTDEMRAVLERMEAEEKAADVAADEASKQKAAE